MLHSLSIGTRGHVPLSTLKALQLASDGLLYTALAPTPPEPYLGGGGGVPWWEPPFEEREIKAYNEDRDLLELAEMIVTSGMLD